MLMQPRRFKIAYEIRTMTVTPELAAQWLQKSRSNRRLISSKVQEYAAEMREGRWRHNAESIKFDWNGNLLDGQHRLNACIKAGASFETDVTFGVDPDVFDTIDIGRRRSASDILSIDGWNNTVALAAATRWVLNIRANRPQSGAPSNHDVRAFCSNEPTIKDSIWAGHLARRIVGPGISIGLHFLFAQKDRPAADQFFNDLATGADLAHDDAVFVLRERLVRARLLKSKLLPAETAAQVIRAWQHRRQGMSTKLIKGLIKTANGYSFPEII